LFPIDSGEEKSVAVTIVTSSPLLKDGRVVGVAREERWKLQRLPALLIAIYSDRAGDCLIDTVDWSFVSSRNSSCHLISLCLSFYGNPSHGDDTKF
jgi:hypothetical protein